MLCEFCASAPAAARALAVVGCKRLSVQLLQKRLVGRVPSPFFCGTLGLCDLFQALGVQHQHDCALFTGVLLDIDRGRLTSALDSVEELLTSVLAVLGSTAGA